MRPAPGAGSIEEPVPNGPFPGAQRSAKHPGKGAGTAMVGGMRRVGAMLLLLLLLGASRRILHPGHLR